MAAALLLGLLSPTSKRSNNYLMLTFVCLFQLMLFLNPIEKAEAKLVAYYNMENTALPKSGYCPVPSYLSSPVVTGSGSATFDWQNSKAGFGKALHVKISSNFGYIDAGTYTIASTSNAYTLSAWVYVFSSTSTQSGHFIVSKYIPGNTNYYSWALSIQQENSNRVPIAFRAGVSSTNALYLQSSGNYPKLTWLHVVGVFNDGGFMKLYVNGTLANNPVNLNGQNAYESSADVAVGGGNVNNFEIYLDEVRIYDHAMTAAQVSTLFGIAATQNPPTVSISPATVTVPIDETTQLSTSVTNPDGRSLSYSWDIAGGCTKADFEPSDEDFANVTITNGQVFSTYTVDVQVYDGLFCATSSAAITLDSSPPGYDISASNYPTNGILNVPAGGTADINLVLTGEPLPTIRWQEYVDLTTRRELNYRHGIWETREMLEMRVEALLQACNATINITTNCAAWVDIANATGARYTTPMGNSNLNHTLLRFSLTNSKGSFISSPVEIVVGVSVSSSSSSSGGDGGSNVGVIVGPIVGVVGACFCFCLLCLVLIVILLLLRRKIVTSGGFPGIPPDYEQIIFGTYMEPMFKIKSKNESALQKLEKLLTTDKDFLLAFAAARGAKKNYEESLARSYVYLFYSHGQCDKALQAFIQQMIDGTADPSTMFRANTIDSKMFKYFSLLVAAQYLWEVLAEFVWEIQQDANPIDNPEGADGGSSGSSSSLSLSSRSASRSKTSRLITGMEVDPTKMDEAADPKVNTLQLWLTAQKIFSAVTRSTSEMPKELADMLVFVHDITKETFSGEEYKAMGGFLFLRYVCPSLLAPHLYGLLEAPPTPTAQRQLILVGKVLQNLSNNTLPGNKEDYMQRLNEFITNNQGDLIAFYDEILSASNLSVTGREVPAQVKRNALADIYNIMLASKEGIFKELGEYYASGESIYEELEAIFSAGPIPTDN